MYPGRPTRAQRIASARKNLILSLSRHGGHSDNLQIFLEGIEEYFSAAEFRARGIKSRHVRTAIIATCKAINGYPDEAPRPAYFVGDLVRIGSQKIERLAGSAAVATIRRFFQEDGITGF